MKKLFDFADIDKCEEIITHTWAEFRNQLACRNFGYDDIPMAQKTTFLRVFNDLFQHGHSFFEKTVGDYFDSKISLTRAARLEPRAPMPSYTRFIPDAKYITGPNRFSPPGVEWLYLAFSPKIECDGLSLEEKCALKECRAKDGEHFVLCAFAIENAYKDRRIIDLTIAKELPFDLINKELEECGEAIYERELKRIYANARISGILPKPNVSELILPITKWATYTYVRLLSEQIFLPLTTEDRNLMYAPFQCMAQYFLQKGYCGIVYSSTVFPAGKNIVFFDKRMASPYGEIKRIEIPKEF